MPDESISPTPAPNPGPTPTGYQRTTGGKGFKWSPPTAEHLSRLLPQYEIECILGHGGMGAVYKGKQKSLDRAVAIKILPPEMDDEDASYVERFKNEAKVMAKFMHPAIVGVFDFGETSEGQLYIVMEYVDGTDVQKMIQIQGRLPPEHALAITAHVCDALRYAHEHGVIHRDIKPANILINMEGAVKVADFGLAKADEAGSSGLTKTGMAMGTPDYVAPEALVMGVNVDGRADLYAIGVMLYNMLTGNVPRGAFKPASVMLPGTDPRFDAIVQRAMQMDREERYQSAAEIRRDLDVILTTPLVQAGGQSSAAIPKQSLPQKPVARGPQKPMGKSANVPVRQGNATAGSEGNDPAPPKPSPLTWALPTALSAIVILGGAYFMATKQDSPTADGPAPAAKKAITTAPIKVREEPKPAPTPISSSPSLPISKSSEPQFPPGKWVKVSGDSESISIKRSTIKQEGIWWVPASRDMDLRVVNLKAQNLGLRATFKRTSQPLSIDIAGSGSSHRLSFQPAQPAITLSIPQEQKTLQTKQMNQSLPEQDFTIEFTCWKGKYLGRINGELVLAQPDSQRSSASVGIYESGMFRDIEVINLDGLPEAEALKILGVDEKGNDLRKPAASVVQASGLPQKSAAGTAAPLSSSPTPPVSKSSDPKFPPGQWVKVFTSADELSTEQRQKESGVTLNQGEVVSTKTTTLYLIKRGQNFKNAACKAVIRDDATFEMRVRDALTPKEHFYALNSSRVAYIERVDGTMKPKVITSLSRDTARPEHLWEFAAVGSQIIARCDGKLICAQKDLRAEEGRIVLANFIGTVRDIEVINLDGLPEAEALRILGVDEKGNDLRALAAKQEEMQKAQTAQADAMAAIPELKALHEQFVKLQAERVTAPFEADVAKLNTGYLGGLDRKIGDEKKAGHLDGVLALEAEKALVAGKQPVPTEDDEKTTAALKELRQIYRDAYAKLEATRAANLKLLTDPLDARLKQLESTLTQQNRIDHAKTVRDYREGLGKEGSADTPVRRASTGGTAATTTEAGRSARAPLDLPKRVKVKPDPDKSRQAAEYALRKGCEVSIDHDGTIIRVNKIDDLPKSRWGLHRVKFLTPVTDEDLQAVTRAVELKEFACNDRVAPGTFTSLAPLGNTPELTILNLSRAGTEFSEADAQALLQSAETLKQLTWLNVERNDALISVVAACKNLDYLYLNATELTDDDMDRLRSLPVLRSLNFRGSKLTDAGARSLAKLKPLIRLSITDSYESGVTPLTPEGLAAITKTHGGTLAELSIGSFGSPQTEGMLRVIAEDCPVLENLTLRGDASPEALAGLSKVKKLKQLTFGQISGKPIPLSVAQCQATSGIKSLETLSVSDCALTSEHVQALAGLKSLRTLHLNRSPGITDASVPFLLSFQELENLGLVNAGLTPAGVLKLTALKKLRTLTLTGIALTDAHIAAFKKARPDVTVVR